MWKECKRYVWKRYRDTSKSGRGCSEAATLCHAMSVSITRHCTNKRKASKYKGLHHVHIREQNAQRS